MLISIEPSLTIIAMTPQIPIHLIDGTLVKVKGKFYCTGQFDKHSFENYIVADKILSLDAI